MSDYDEDDDSQLVGREPCPKCGSKDNLARYSDGHAYCYSAACDHYERADGSAVGESRPARKVNTDLLQGTVVPLSKRKISSETCARYHYKVATFKGMPCQVATYTDWSGNPQAQKLRFADKAEGMPWVGNNKGVALFGAHLSGKGKRIVITEGEIDAMSVSQIQGNKWPVVSLINGAKGAKKDIAHSLDYLKNFDEVVLMFDMDEPGRVAVEEAAEVLTGHKVLVASLPLKDANECLVAGKADAVIHAIWNAKPYAPASVQFGQDIINRRRNRPLIASVAYPDWLPEFNKKVLGDRLAELTTWTSGSGMGKTTMLRQLQLHFYRTTSYNQALIMLEEPLEDTADEMVATYIEKRMKLPEVAKTVTAEEIERAEADLFLSTDDGGSHRFYFHDAFGSMGPDVDLMNRIRYFAHAHDCKIVWLDHLSILVSDMDQDGDERRRIDALMHQLKGLTIELGIAIHLVCHLKKATGNVSFEEGAVPSLDDLRGSGGIKQLSNNVYAISRNQQAETETQRNTAQVHILKCRYTGDTGAADFIFFDKLTGTFIPGNDPDGPQFVDQTDEFAGSQQGF